MIYSVTKSLSIIKISTIIVVATFLLSVGLPDKGVAAFIEPQLNTTETVTAEPPQILTVNAAKIQTPNVERDKYSAYIPVVNPILAAAKNRYTVINPPASVYSGEAVIAFASQFVGVVPYGMGNTPTTSFSCDGYTQYVLANFGIHLPRLANSQAALGVPISASDAKAGDLLWWPGQHIAFYDGNGGMYDSPTWGRYVQHRNTIWGNPVYIRLK